MKVTLHKALQKLGDTASFFSEAKCICLILLITAGVDLHIRHESELPVCRKWGCTGQHTYLITREGFIRVQEFGQAQCTNLYNS